jgi:hypothetical protein
MNIIRKEFYFSTKQKKKIAIFPNSDSDVQQKRIKKTNKTKTFEDFGGGWYVFVLLKMGVQHDLLAMTNLLTISYPKNISEMDNEREYFNKHFSMVLYEYKQNDAKKKNTKHKRNIVIEEWIMRIVYYYVAFICCVRSFTYIHILMDSQMVGIAH